MLRRWAKFVRVWYVNDRFILFWLNVSCWWSGTRWAIIMLVLWESFWKLLSSLVFIVTKDQSPFKILVVYILLVPMKNKVGYRDKQNNIWCFGKVRIEFQIKESSKNFLNILNTYKVDTTWYCLSCLSYHFEVTYFVAKELHYSG